jgi:predicted aldo/keto reductase-like oxidoreductase
MGKEGAIPCTGCKYCLADCPQGIEIADCFIMYNESQRAGSDYNRKMMYHTIPAGKKGEDCTECGICLSHCPQKIDIPPQLKMVASHFDWGE